MNLKFRQDIEWDAPRYVKKGIYWLGLNRTVDLSCQRDHAIVCCRNTDACNHQDINTTSDLFWIEVSTVSAI